MKNPLTKRMIRFFFRNPGKFLPLFLALTFIVTFSSSFFTSQASVKRLYYKQLDEGQVEDGQFTTISPLSEDLIAQLEGEKLVLYENFSRELKQGNGRILKAFINREGCNLPQILEGRLAETADEVAVSANYARAHQLQIGDKISLEDRELLITGFVSLPDYSSLLKNRADLVMDTGHFASCLLAAQGFTAFDQVPQAYTYSYQLKESLDKQASREKLQDIISIINEKNLVIDGVIQEDNHCITYIMDDMEGDVPTMTLFMLILCLALAFISAVQMKSLIEKEAPVLGTLLALGYTKKDLMRAYLVPPLLLAMLAGLTGNVLAYAYAYKKYVNLYYVSFDLPKFVPLFSLRAFALTCILPLAIYVSVNLAVLAKSLHFTPLAFIRGQLTKVKKHSKLQLRSYPFISKFRIRVALDNKFNILALVFGLLLANIILIYGLAVKPVFLQYADHMQDAMAYRYTYLVKTAEPGLEAEQATILPLELCEKEDKKVQIFGIDPGSKYEKEDGLALKDQEIIASQGFLDRFSYQVGDQVRVREPYHGKELTLRIAGVARDNKLFQLFGPRASVNEMVGKEPAYSNAYLSDQALTISAENLITIIDKATMTQFMDHFLEGFGLVFDLMFYIGIGFSLIVTSIVTNLIVDKARINIGYLKIFGFHNREVARIYVYGVLLALLVFQVLMIPAVDKLMRAIMLASMTKLDAYFIADIPLISYFKAVACSLLIFLLVQLYDRYKISRLDMVQELKTING